MKKLETRAEDQKLKINLEWPYFRYKKLGSQHTLQTRNTRKNHIDCSIVSKMCNIFKGTLPNYFEKEKKNVIVTLREGVRAMTLILA